jgi:hypothetical protein
MLRELPFLLASEKPLNLRAPSFVDVSRSRDSASGGAVVSDMRDKVCCYHRSRIEPECSAPESRKKAILRGLKQTFAISQWRL